VGTAFLVRLPIKTYTQIRESYWADTNRFHKLIHTYVPRLKQLSATMAQKIILLFREVRFQPGQQILKEGDEKNFKFYLIAQGDVKLECMNNPYRRRDYNNQDILKKVPHLSNVFDMGTGIGNINTTFFKTHLGIVTQG